jgi:hypothetical protein
VTKAEMRKSSGIERHYLRFTIAPASAFSRAPG